MKKGEDITKVNMTVPVIFLESQAQLAIDILSIRAAFEVAFD